MKIRVRATTHEGNRTIFHLDCGHEVVVAGQVSAPNRVECKYCSKVKTQEEEFLEQQPGNCQE